MLFTLILFITQKTGEIEPFAHFDKVSISELAGYIKSFGVTENSEPFGVYPASEVNVNSLVLSR